MNSKKLDFLKLNALGHRPQTRREWFGALGSGAIGLSAIGTIRNASAALQAPSPKDFPAVIVMDLIGGAGLSGNFLVGKSGGPNELLSSYSRLGWNPRKHIPDTSYGAALAPPEVSQLHAGFLASTTPATREGTQFATLCHFSQDDSPANAHSIHSEAMRFLGRKGFSQKGLGMSSATSGGNSQSVTVSRELAPSQIKSIEEYSRVVQLYEFERRGFLNEGVKSFVQNFSTLSSLQLQRLFTNTAENGILSKLQKDLDELKRYNPNFITDPRKDETAKKIFQLSDGILPNSLEAVVATISYHAIQGNVGPSTLMLGGYDYHDGTQTTGDQADLKAGKILGQILEYARMMNRKLMIQIITDGSVYSDLDSRVWRGDAGDKGMTVLVFFDPTQKRALKKTQLGSFTDGQSVDTNHWMARNIQGVGRVSFLNYLAFAGAMDEVTHLYPENELPPGKLSDWLCLET
jgi:hypothetical protein